MGLFQSEILDLLHIINVQDVKKKKLIMIEAVANPHLRWGNRQSRGVA